MSQSPVTLSSPDLAPLPNPHCLPTVLPAAFMTMVLIFLHTFWGILFFHGCENRRWWEIVAVVVMHLAVSGSVSSQEQSSVLPPGVAVGYAGPCLCGGAATCTSKAAGFWGPELPTKSSPWPVPITNQTLELLPYSWCCE